MAHKLYRWTDRDGRAWECDAYDHGPMCRLCRLVPEEELAAIAAHMVDVESRGYFVVCCLACDEGGPPMPIPFLDQPARDLWIEQHRSVGHQVFGTVDPEPIP